MDQVTSHLPTGLLFGSPTGIPCIHCPAQDSRRFTSKVGDWITYVCPRCASLFTVLNQEDKK
jgi:hypothetical protein